MNKEAGNPESCMQLSCYQEINRPENSQAGKDPIKLETELEHWWYRELLEKAMAKTHSTTGFDLCESVNSFYFKPFCFGFSDSCKWMHPDTRILTLNVNILQKLYSMQVVSNKITES